ncbi:MAG: aminomethyl-transferring glycine dehydrogenase subunit GcvPB [Phycisphaerae bacterium]
MKLIYDRSVPNRRGATLPQKDVPTSANIPEQLRRSHPAELPEVSELDVMRHFTELSQKNFGVDSGFYPLGSCTMKYNPRMNEQVARDGRFAALHPLLPRIEGGEDLVQGALAVLHETDLLLREITGMAEFTSQPMAGANGELTGVLIMAAYHRSKGTDRKTILIPDSAHGTNPASAAIAGFEVRTIASDENGLMGVDALKEALDEDVAGLMLTSPNTLGLFNPHVDEICRLVHEIDGLVYYDGANLNALLGRARPGDMGFDIVHLNLHKTFSTPHGGGGPGAGPVGVIERLRRFLPTPIAVRGEGGKYHLDYDRPDSIGAIAPHYGNFNVYLKALAYLLLLGRDGLLRVSENAVLNANYLKEKLREHYDLPYGQLCKHECVFSASRQKKNGVAAVDVAKALIERGFHPPTVYFPLIVDEAMMIEPTETEGAETLDAFVAAMVEIAQLAESDPDSLHECPTKTPVRRLDETQAAREPDVALL